MHRKILFIMTLIPLFFVQCKKDNEEIQPEYEWKKIIDEANNPMLKDVNFLAVYFIDESTGWVSEASNIYKTSDGGVNWTRVTPNSGIVVDGEIEYLKFVDANHGYAGIPGDGLWETTNGGTSWTQIDEHCDKMYFVTSDTIITYCSRGAEWAKFSTDQGATWQSYSASEFYSTLINNICFLEDKSVGFASSESKMFKSNDKGMTWSLAGYNNIGAKDIYFKNENEGFVIGHGLLKTSTGISTEDWTLDLTITGSKVKGFGDHIFFLGGKVKESTDLMTTVKAMEGEYNDVGLSDMFFLNETTGFVVGYYGTFLKYKKTIE